MLFPQFRAINLAQRVSIQIGNPVPVDAAVHANHLIREAFDKAQIVRHQDDRDLGAQLFQEFHESFFHREIHVGRRFIQEQQARVREERAGDEDALLLAAGKGGEGAFFHPRQADAPEALVRRFPVFRGVTAPPRKPVQAPHENHFHAGHRELGIEMKMLRHVADEAATRVRRVIEDLNSSALWFEQAERQLQERAFPAAVGPDHGHALAFFHPEADVHEDGHFPVAEVRFSEVERRAHGRFQREAFTASPSARRVPRTSLSRSLIGWTVAPIALAIFSALAWLNCGCTRMSFTPSALA